MSKKILKPEGWVVTDGICLSETKIQTDKTLWVELYFKDSRGYWFSVRKRISKKELER